MASSFQGSVKIKPRDKPFFTLMQIHSIGVRGGFHAQPLQGAGSWVVNVASGKVLTVVWVMMCRTFARGDGEDLRGLYGQWGSV